MNIKKSVAFLAIMTTLCTGCRSKDEYTQLANAGSKYSGAVETLLNSTENYQIKATSEQLLHNHELASLSIEEYKKLSQEDEKRIAIVNDLIKHNDLLHVYFNKLGELASSDSPEQSKQEINDITNNLSNIGQKLQATGLIRNSSIVSSVADFAIDEQISGVLRQVIKDNNPLILKELTIQQDMLKALSEDIKDNIASIKELEEYRLVIEPLTQSAPIPDPDKWIEIRQKIMLMQSDSIKYQKASSTLEEFKLMYISFISGKTNKETLKDFVNNVDTFLAFVQTDK